MQINKEAMAFVLSGVIFFAIVAGINFAIHKEMTVVTTIVTLAFGGFVGLMAITPHTSFIKNLVFGAAIIWVIWIFLNPIENLANTLVFRKLEIILLASIGVIFLERETLNSVDRMLKRPQHALTPGIIGITLVFLVLFPAFGVNDLIGELFTKYWYIGLIATLAYWLILAKLFGIRINKLVDKISNR